MPAHFFLDASALTKRFLKETGTDVVNQLFQKVPHHQLACLTLGTLEIISAVVRARNRGTITPAECDQAILNIRSEIFDDSSFVRVSATDERVIPAAVWISKHAVNATDALVLGSALEYSDQLKAQGQSLVLVACDLRLLKAADAEGLLTFNPEIQTSTDLDFLIVMPP